MLFILKKKTLDFYSRNFIKLNYEEFYNQDNLEIEKINLSEISKELNIPKESARRKVAELEKEGVIKRIKKKIVMDKSVFILTKPIDTMKRTSRYLAALAEILKKDKILSKSFTSETIEKNIKNDFSYVWKLYYELQIPLLLKWKKIFADLETFHIWAIIVVNDQLKNKKNNFNHVMSREKFLKIMFLSSSKNIGINAMSISEISKIPRATVIRKLNKLITKNFLRINKKKHYKIKETHMKKLLPINKENIVTLGNFSKLIYNLIMSNEDKNDAMII